MLRHYIRVNQSYHEETHIFSIDNLKTKNQFNLYVENIVAFKARINFYQQ